MGEVRAAVGGGVESAAEAATIAALSASKNAALAPTVFERDSAGQFGYEYEALAALQNQLAADEWKRIPFRSARASENERDHKSNAKEHWALVPENAGGTLSHAQAAELDLGTRVEQMAYPSISRKSAQQLARHNLRSKLIEIITS